MCNKYLSPQKLRVRIPLIARCTWLTLRQNKHVLRASRETGAPQKSGHKAIYLSSQIIGSKTHRKSSKMKYNTNKCYRLYLCMSKHSKRWQNGRHFKSNCGFCCYICMVTKWKVMGHARWLLQYLTSGVRQSRFYPKYIEYWHQGVVLVYTLCQWKVRGALLKVVLCLWHKLAVIRPWAEGIHHQMHPIHSRHNWCSIV